MKEAITKGRRTSPNTAPCLRPLPAFFPFCGVGTGPICDQTKKHDIAKQMMMTIAAFPPWRMRSDAVGLVWSIRQ